VSQRGEPPAVVVDLDHAAGLERQQRCLHLTGFQADETMIGAARAWALGHSWADVADQFVKLFDALRVPEVGR